MRLSAKHCLNNGEGRLLIKWEVQECEDHWGPLSRWTILNCALNWQNHYFNEYVKFSSEFQISVGLLAANSSSGPMKLRQLNTQHYLLSSISPNLFLFNIYDVRFWTSNLLYNDVYFIITSWLILLLNFLNYMIRWGNDYNTIYLV